MSNRAPAMGKETIRYDWLIKKMGPPATELQADELAKLEKEKIAIIYFYPESDEDALSFFMQVAEKFEDIPCRYSTNTALKNTYDPAPYAFVLLRTFDEGKKFMVGGDRFTGDSMMKFVGMHMFPLVMDFNEKAAERIFGTEKPAFILLTDDEDSEEVRTFRAFAKENQGRILYSKSEVSEGLGSRLAEFLGVTTEDAPTGRIIHFTNNHLKKFIVNDLSADGLKTALDDYESGALPPYYKSEPVPETNDEPVKVIVGTTFNEMVLDNDNYVLVEVYAPWCGHCQQLEPIYKELGEKTASLDNLVIAKIDATANEHETINIEGFPTIYLYKPGSKPDPVTYEGDRTLDDLIQFIERETGLDIMETIVKSEDL